VALTGPAPPLDPTRKSPAPRRRCQNSLLPFRKPYLASSWKALAPLQGAIIRLTPIRRSRRASTLRLPSVTPSGWRKRAMRIFFLIVITHDRDLRAFASSIARSCSSSGSRTRRVHRRLPGCGAHRSRATPGSWPPQIPCTPEAVPEPKFQPDPSSWRALAPLQGAIIRLTPIRRSRRASTLRLPSVTPSG
jgi:hypothetical protein